MRARETDGTGLGGRDVARRNMLAAEPMRRGVRRVQVDVRERCREGEGRREGEQGEAESAPTSIAAADGDDAQSIHVGFRC
jgi:hypothetical protein